MGHYQDANILLNIAADNYAEKKAEYEKTQHSCEKKLKELDKFKLDIWAGFSDFVNLYKSIKNIPPKITGMVCNENLDLSLKEIDEIDINSKIAIDFIVDGVSSATKGVGAGMALGSSLAIAGAIGTMGLTWVGVSGGLGAAVSMAEVYMALYGISVSPLAVVAVPALVIGGVLFDKKGREKVNEALKRCDEAKEACVKFDEAIDFITTIEEKCSDIQREINRLYDFYKFKLTKLSEIVKRTTDFNKFTKDEQYILASNIILVKLLKEILVTKLIDKADSENAVECDTQNISVVLDQSKKTRSELIEKETVLISDDKLKYTVTNAIINKADNSKLSSISENEINQKTKAEKNQEYVNTILRIKSELIVDSSIEFRNCKIEFYDNAVVRIDNGQLTLTDCEVYIETNYSDSLIELNGSSAKITNCKFSNNVQSDEFIEYSSELDNKCFIHCSNRQDKKTVLKLSDTDINNFENCFIIANDTTIAELVNVNITKHKGTFVFSKCDSSWDNSGITIKNVNFNECFAYVRDEGNNNLFSECFFGAFKSNDNKPKETICYVKHNALIRLYYSNCKCDNVSFNNIENYILDFDSMSGGQFTLKNSTISNISINKNMYYRNAIFNITNGNIIVDGCSFEKVISKPENNTNDIMNMIISTGRIGESLNHENKIIGCKFENCVGRLEFSYGIISDCVYNNCEISIWAQGKPSGSDRYVTTITNCDFNNCKSNFPIINCDSYLDKTGIAVRVKYCNFHKCKSHNLIDETIKVYGMFGREKYITIAELSNNNYHKK